MADVLLVSPSFFSVGGVQRLMREVVAHSGHAFDVLVRRSEYDRARAEALERRFSGRVRLRPTRFALGLHHLRIGALLARRRYDAVYISSMRHTGAALLPALAGVHTVCHAHGNDVFETQNTDPITRKLLVWGRRRVDRFVAVSDWTRDQLLRHGPAGVQVEVIPNGVDAARFRSAEGARSRIRKEMNLSDTDFSVLTVARLVPRKGHRFVIEALRSLEEVTYVIVGKGPERARLERAARDTGVRGRVHFAGYVPEETLPGYYHACDAYVMPSEHLEDAGSVEGFGLTFLEANAAGKAAVGTRVGGIPSAIEHEHNGLLCAPTAEAVRGAIERLKDDPAFRRTLEENALRWADRHDWRRIVERIDQALVAQRGRCRNRNGMKTADR